MHYHKVFGFTIESEIPLPELIKIDKTDKPQIKIVKGTDLIKPAEDLLDTVYRSHTIMNKDMFYLEIPDTAKYFVEKVSDITYVTIEQLDPKLEHDMYAFLYGSVITAVLQMNDTFALHASAVRVDGKLHLFCGISGMGKSTLAAQLNTRGYQIFSDDKCVLRWNKEEGQFYAEPTLQIVRLWEDAHELLDDDGFINNPTPVMNRINKHQYHIEEGSMITEPQPIARINIMRRLNSEDPTPSTVELKGLKKIRLLKMQIHRHGYLKAFGKLETLWDFLSHLVQHVPVYAFRKTKDTPVLQFVDFVERNLVIDES